VTHITEGFTFLGYRIIRARGGRGKLTPKVLIPERAVKRCQHAVRSLLAPRTTHESTVAKIQATNGLTRGWCPYDRNTSSPSEIFGNLSHELIWDMTHWLGRKYKISAPEVMTRSKRANGTPMTLSPKTVNLVLPHAYKARKRLAQSWHNPYTAKEAVIREKLLWYEGLWRGNENRLGGGDLREEVLLLKGTTCHACGTTLHPSEVEVDHVIPRGRCKEPTEADRMKHLQPLCTSCHRAKTKTDLKVLSRMR
jgi:hypothetical protein